MTPLEAVDLDGLEQKARAATKHLSGHDLTADGFGLQVWGQSQRGGATHVMDVRGWGYLTGHGHGALGLSDEEGAEAQRAVQAYVVAAWNALPFLIQAARERDGLRDAVDAFLKAGGANPAVGKMRFRVWSLPLLGAAFDQARATRQSLAPNAGEPK